MNEAHDCVRWSTCWTRIKANVYERGELQTRYKFESTIIVCPSTSHQSIVISSTLRHEIFIGFLSFFFYIYTTTKKCSTLSSSRTHNQHRMPHHFSEQEGKFNVERRKTAAAERREVKRSSKSFRVVETKLKKKHEKSHPWNSFSFSSFHRHFTLIFDAVRHKRRRRGRRRERCVIFILNNFPSQGHASRKFRLLSTQF